MKVLRDPAFRLFWTAGIVSELGTGVGTVAFPLTAVLVLKASAMDMGILSAASQLPVLFLALHAGVWVDRLPRKPIMVATNIGRGLLLALVPLAAFAGLLRMPVLWGVALATGVLAVVFDLAMTSYPPSLVPREQLVDANAVIQGGGRAAQIAGPGVAGWLVNAIGAPAGVLVDAVSFVVSALMLTRLPAAAPIERPERASVRAEIAEGLRTVWHDEILRPMVLVTTLGSFGGAIGGAVFVLFAVRHVGVTPPTLGTIYAAGSVAGLLGAFVAGRLSRRITAGGAMLLGQGVHSVGAFVILAAPRGFRGAVMVGAVQVLFVGGLAVFSVTQISLRQAITPPHLLGRVNATRRLTVFGIIPVGALLGGWLGTAFGLRATLVAALVAELASLGVMLASPLRKAIA